MNAQPLSTATALQATKILGLLGELNSRLEKEAAISLLHCREQEELDVKLGHASSVTIRVEQAYPDAAVLRFVEEYACLDTRAREAVSAKLRNDIRRNVADLLQSLHDLDVTELVANRLFWPVSAARVFSQSCLDQMLLDESVDWTLRVRLSRLESLIRRRLAAAIEDLPAEQRIRIGTVVANGQEEVPATSPKRGRRRDFQEERQREMVADRWQHFKANYRDLDYPKASFEFFARWATDEFDDMPSDHPDDLRRMVDAHRKTPASLSSKEAE